MNKRYPVFDDCIHLERFTGCDYCAKKNLLAWASGKTHAITVKDLATGSACTIENASTPRFSPDGETLFYLSRGQMLLAKPDGTDAKTLCSFSGPVIDPIWSPDGARILFASAKSASMGTGADAAPVKHPGGPGNTPVVIEDFGYKFDGAGYIRPDSHTHLFVAEVSTGGITQLTSGVRDEMHHTWMPDSQHVVYCGNENRPKEQSIGYDLFTVDLQGNKKQISEGLWMVSYPNPIRPVVTPDGKYVIMGVMNPYADTSLGYPDIVFYRFPADGQGDPTALFEKSDTCYQCVQFPYNAGCGWGMDKVQITPDGKYVYFVSGFNGRGNVYKLCLEGDDRHAITVLDGQQVCHGLGRIQGGKLLLTLSRTDMPESYYLLDTATDTLSGPVAQSAQDLTEEVILTPAEDFTVPTADGESSIHGWVQPPVNLDPTKKYPAILYIHGGPHPFYTYGLTMEHQCFAAQGYAVLYCNPRGSSGYGPKHQNVRRAFDGSAYNDLMTFVEEALRRYPWIDPDRLGVTGGSYGGYMTNYIATHADRFRCYITQRSVANDLIGYASSDMQGSSQGYDTFEAFMLAKLMSSPVSYAEKIDKPFLILHGEDDYRCPVEGAHQLFIAVKDTHPDLPVKLVIYPHTHHEQPSNPRLLKHYYDEMLAWFNKYL